MPRAGFIQTALGAAGLVALTAAVSVAFQAQKPEVILLGMADPGSPAASTTLRGTVQNRSTATISVEVAFYKGDPLVDEAAEIERKTLTLAPGNSNAVASTPLATAEGDQYTVCADPDGKLPDANRNNNCQTRTVSRQSVDLRVTTSGIRMEPFGVNVGEPMTVTALVENLTPRPATTMARLYQSHPASPGAKLLGQTAVAVPGSGKSMATWSIVRPAGDTNLFVRLETTLPDDNVTTNNLASRNIFLKAIISRGRTTNDLAGQPVFGDLLGTGQPVMVFHEHLLPGDKITALQLYPDGSYVELWSKPLVPGNARGIGPALADLDNDGVPEIVTEVTEYIDTSRGGKVHVFALRPDGSVKWTRSWQAPGSGSCHNYQSDSVPAIGDWNGDKIADVAIYEKEFVVLDGKTGGELLRRPIPGGGCIHGNTGNTMILDIDGDGKNEFIAGSYGLKLWNNDGTIRWEKDSIDHFIVIDLEKDGVPEVIAPVHRGAWRVFDARTGAAKASKTIPGFSAAAIPMVVTTSLNPQGLPTIFASNNDARPGVTAMSGSKLDTIWHTFPLDLDGNPRNMNLADLMGLGRPQIAHASDRRFIMIQDSKDGKLILGDQIYGGSHVTEAPVPVDADGDGKAELVMQYGKQDLSSTRRDFEPRYPVAAYLIFGSAHWKKVPITWNHRYFMAGQVNKKLTFMHDYQPWKTHNTWRQQPLPLQCDIDGDDDVDREDVDLVFAVRGQAAREGDPRDVDKDGQITVSDTRICTQKCTQGNCTVIQPPARILTINPRVGYPGKTIRATITGEGLGMRGGVTMASFGPGISVGGEEPGQPGPVTVVDANTAFAQLTIEPGMTGPRVVVINTAGRQAVRADLFTLTEGNKPPVVTVGPDQMLLNQYTVNISGTVTDDNLPTTVVGTSWQRVSGPGSATIANPGAMSTSVTFTAPGLHVLRLTASDGELSSTDELVVKIAQENVAPVISAGDDRVVTVNQPVTLMGSVDDDGLPFGAVPTASWQKMSGPGVATFANATMARTDATFSLPGTYVLRLTATDTHVSSNDEVTVVVEPPAPALASVMPGSGVGGEALTVQLRGENTKFLINLTEANFGPGISVGAAAPGAYGKVLVTSPTTAVAQVVVAPGTPLGDRPVVVKTGDETVSLSGGFLVAATPSQGPASVAVELSEQMIVPGETITVQPVVRDRNGKPIENAAFDFDIRITGENFVSGVAPVVNGRTITFPKMTKTMVNVAPTLDPQLGPFLHGDPTDANYGKETGGLFKITATLKGTSLTGATTAVIVPTGTAEITVSAHRYGKRLADVLTDASTALKVRDKAGLGKAIDGMNELFANSDYYAEVIRINNIFAPPNGSLPSVQMLQAKGLGAAPDDTRWVQGIDALLTLIRTAKTRINALNPATMTQADVQALKAIADQRAHIINQLANLKPGALAIFQNRQKVEMIMRIETPQLYDTMRQKMKEMIAALPPTSRPAVRAAAADTFLAAGGVDFEGLISTAFSYFTEIIGNGNAKGSARDNIIELGVSLVNNVFHIMLTQAINYFAPPGMDISIIRASASTQFACPRFPNTIIGGAGFSSDPFYNQVMVMGCIDSQLVRSLSTLTLGFASAFPKKAAPATGRTYDIGGMIRLAWRTRSIQKGVDRLLSDNSPAADVYPDLMQPGLPPAWPQEMLFQGGWPRVNQGRLHCVGTVFVMNTETGGFKAENLGFLPTCD